MISEPSYALIPSSKNPIGSLQKPYLASVKLNLFTNFKEYIQKA